MVLDMILCINFRKLMSSNKLITARKGGGMVESKESKYLWNFLFLLFGYSIPTTSNVAASMVAWTQQ
ncbi:hypothetical protein Peur_067219 [Populus x canadensis]